MAGGMYCIIQMLWEMDFSSQTPTQHFPENAGYSADVIIETE